MKTIGILGGMSWESTALHYRRIRERLEAAGITVDVPGADDRAALAQDAA